MTEQKFEIKTLNDKVLETLEEVANTTNPFKLFFLMGKAWRDIVLAIEESAIEISDKIETEKKSGLKEAILYSLVWKNTEMTAALKKDEKFLNEHTWEKIKLQKWVLSVCPNYQSLPLDEKWEIVRDYYGKNSKSNIIEHLTLEWWVFGLESKYAKQIAESINIPPEKVIRELLGYHKFLLHDRELAMRTEPLKYEYYGKLGIVENEKRSVEEFLYESWDIIKAYIKAIQDKRVQEELAKAKNQLDASFREVEKNSVYHEKLSLLKSSIVRISQSMLSPIILPFLIRKIAKNFEKDAIKNLKIPEFALGRHFAKNYEEYFLIKKFFASLKREIENPTKIGWPILLFLLVGFFAFPLFFFLSIVLFLGYQLVTHTHRYQEFTLKNGNSILALPLLILFSCGTVFFFSYTHGDFYRIQYERFQENINYVFLTSGWDGITNMFVSENMKTDAQERPSIVSWPIITGSGKVWADTYRKCVNYNYVLGKKSCVED